MLRSATEAWSIQDSDELYEISRWGKGYFAISEQGHLLVDPERDGRQIDLKELIDRLELRGTSLPILVRFNQIIRDRLKSIHRAFESACETHEYAGQYICVYPIKVNQQRQVVEQVVQHGRSYGYGLEAGSKPEMLAVVAYSDEETPIICNGFKDSEYIEAAILAQKLGRTVIPVVEKFTELDDILEIARKHDVRPIIGLRLKLATRGAGRWQASGGHRSKFGLTVSEAIDAVDRLRTEGLLDCLHLLHFHLGSQITNIRHIKNALIESARLYVALRKLGADSLHYLDVGGGLGVDYDGSQTDFNSSINYTLQEYANDVVFHIQSVCDEADAPHPNIISESGRAIVAYHSALIFNVLGVAHQPCDVPELSKDELDKMPSPLADLSETYEALSIRNARECFHDAQQAFDMGLAMFSSGHMTLDERALLDLLYWGICKGVRQRMLSLDDLREPDEMESIDRALAETYFCNFSLFQSLPDSWAIGQLFPVIPIHRLNEKPTSRAVLGDITCDSDGKIDQFVNRKDPKRTLQLHDAEKDKPYYLGAFLVGAYQETLGDLHNLFGDTHAVHVEIDDDGEVLLPTTIKGDTVGQVLGYVEYNRNDLVERLQTVVESAVQKRKLNNSEAGYLLRFYEAELNGYTYLE